jgi:hypothetical protein
MTAAGLVANGFTPLLVAAIDLDGDGVDDRLVSLHTRDDPGSSMLLASLAGSSHRVLPIEAAPMSHHSTNAVVDLDGGGRLEVIFTQAVSDESGDPMAIYRKLARFDEVARVVGPGALVGGSGACIDRYRGGG